ncbi:Protein of unknown function [Oceanobacillus limi]|uniref:DUF2691 domain-containing protein n=1 Tax=Oceanobacillus limi TaxID=930131 RepID=A0A1I0GKF4_9BACI|nr:DUF2691 family protein [Oceanobacillus limi]SET71439.1 Protein of unknown function [Oceanobacillus limi]
MRGLSFEIPNTYGKFLYDILGEMDFSRFVWYVQGVESYIMDGNDLSEKLLFPTTAILDGEKLKQKVSSEAYYLIFADLKAFPHESDVSEITTYQEFVTSNCQFVLLVVDSSYVSIYAKDQKMIQQLYANAQAAGYENIEFTTEENDKQTTLQAF